ncbi:MAG: MtrB/PioB family outer membrane beta-barrel protein [Azonexus sp.]|jgi:hypothetical protein|nr:MtrB/PioB family outer membrane beta-barrel protein [Azonexus sp.]
MKKIMQTTFRRKLIAIGVLAAISQMAAADSGVGVDTWLGNSFTPTGVTSYSNLAPKDEDGLGATENNQRSPSGFLLYETTQIRPYTQFGSAGWKYRGSIEAGAIGVMGSGKEARDFQRYRDLDSGLYLSNFHLEAENDQSARFFEVFGGSVTEDDQYYGVRLGRYNDWRVKLFYNETRHVFTSTYRSLFNGVGTDMLTLSQQALAAGLRPGGKNPDGTYMAGGGATAGTPADTTSVKARATAALAATSEDTLELIREKSGARLDMNLTEKWKVFASYTHEKRDGARPFGTIGSTNGGGGSATEIAEPIDYTTHDFAAGLQYADDLNALNLTVAASIFRNNYDSVSFQNPWGINNPGSPTNNAPNGVPLSTMALAPDNEYYNVKGEYSRNFPEFYKGKFTAVVSLASSRQDDDLLPYASTFGGNDPYLSNIGGMGSNGGNANLNILSSVPWTSTAALGQKSSDAKIDTTLVDLGGSISPTNELTVKARLRYFETDNSTKFNNCNPYATYSDGSQMTYRGCTGVWGRITGDGTNTLNMVNANRETSFVYPTALIPGNNVGIVGFMSNVPWDRKETLGSLSFDYRLSNFASVYGSYERENIKRSYREVDKTKEDKFKLGYTNRRIAENGTLRVSFEHDDRDGSNYDRAPYSAFLAGAILEANGQPVKATETFYYGTYVGLANADLRKYDLADRKQNILNLRYNHAFTSNFDGAINVQIKRLDFPDMYGRTDKQKLDTISLDLNYQAALETTLYGFYSYQKGEMSQRVLSAADCSYANFLIGACSFTPAPGGTAGRMNSNNRWEADMEDTNHTLGFGIRQTFGKLLLDANYVYNEGKSKIHYDAFGTAATVSATNDPSTGQFPDTKIKTHSLQANLIYPLEKSMAIRLLYAWEKGSIDDWHYAGNLTGNVGGASQILMDGGPEDYSVHVIGLFLNAQF